MVENHVKTQNLKTHIVPKVLRVTALLQSAQMGVPRDDSFDQHVVNSLLYLPAAVPQFVKGFVD